MSDSEIMVRLKNIAKTYGEGEARVQVLKGLDLEVRRGEMLAIVGPSGVGKSTLLHLVGLLDRADGSAPRAAAHATHEAAGSQLKHWVDQAET